MAESLAQFLVRRRREVEDEARALEVQIRKLEDEERQLIAAAIGAGLKHIFNAGSPQEDGLAAVEAAAKRSGKVAPERTIKEAVIEMLLDEPVGLVALDILAAINTRFGFDYPRTSLSPQLSRLKSEGWLERNGLSWTLTDYARLMGGYSPISVSTANEKGSTAEVAVEPERSGIRRL